VGNPEGLLAGLGDTPDEVAGCLLALGCRGVRGSAGRCPVAAYLRRAGLADARLDNATVEWDDVRRAYLPDAVGCFVRLFDLGLYPALDAGREEG
jgi:hypothetical protein